MNFNEIASAIKRRIRYSNCLKDVYKIIIDMSNKPVVTVVIKNSSDTEYSVCEMKLKRLFDDLVDSFKIHMVSADKYIPQNGENLYIIYERNVFYV